uniref:Putative secreted protein n=1 Tax=Ixodes ricinus TaxID=34613 RepID=A0A0K8R523_IXORI
MSVLVILQIERLEQDLMLRPHNTVGAILWFFPAAPSFTTLFQLYCMLPTSKSVAVYATSSPYVSVAVKRKGRVRMPTTGPDSFPTNFLLSPPIEGVAHDKPSRRSLE